MLALVSMTSQVYLPQFKVLYKSFREFHPDWPCVVYTDGPVTGLPQGVIPITMTPDGRWMAHGRPAILRDQLRQFPKVCFTGADCEFFAPLTQVVELLDKPEVAMAAVPCIQKPLPYHSGYPRTQTYCQTGNLNTDFIVAKACPETFEGLGWWQEACDAHCRVDLANGFFNEHAWFGLMPTMMDKFHIWRTKTHNVCYWNVQLYNLHLADGGWKTEGGALAHFHYSGFNPNDPASTSQWWQHPGKRATGDLLAFYTGYQRRLLAEQ